MKILLLLLAINFIADQLFQHPDIIRTKHKDTTALFLHVLTWSISTFAFASVIILLTGKIEIYMWWISTFVIHFAVEWCCLRMWTYHYYDNKRSKMVFWILLEQLIINVATIGLFVYLMDNGLRLYLVAD